MIETDIPDDIVVRRYLTPLKFEYLINNKSLYMASYSGFSDQLEGGISAADYIRNSNEPDLLSAADGVYCAIKNPTEWQRIAIIRP